MEEKNRKYVLIRCQGSSLVKVNLVLAFFFIRFSRRMNMSIAIEKIKEKERRKTRKDNGKIRTYDRLW
jgi:hypothetical protein